LLGPGPYRTDFSFVGGFDQPTDELDTPGLRANAPIARSGDANGNNPQLTVARVCLPAIQSFKGEAEGTGCSAAPCRAISPKGCYR
jgi:hypothetical protein